MTIQFKNRNDSVFILYSNIVEEGNYLNDFDDSSDFAGFFLMDNIKDSVVTTKIKSYRDVEDLYEVKLMFLNNGEKMLWSISSSPVAYLPKKAEFRFCK